MGNDGPVPSPLRDEVGLPREVYALLAQANLLRMRGRWDESVDNCMAALRLAPDSPSAQSLLGDIYENQGRLDDAIQWYRMALDASPDSPADRLKLDRLLRRQAPLLHGSHETSPGELDIEQDDAPIAPALTASALTAPSLLWRKLTRDPESALRLAALAAALLVCLIVIFAYAAVHQRATLSSLGLGQNQEVKAAPVVVPPTSATPSLAETVPRDSAEQAVLGTLRGSRDLTAQSITVGDVQFDPRTGRMGITLILPAGSSLSHAAVLRSALRAAQTGAAASPSATAFTLRGLTASSAGGGPTLVFVGDVSQTALPAAGAAEPDDEHVQALFTDPWWSPQAPG